MSIQDNEKLAEDFVTTWASRDPDATMALVADGAVWHDVGIPQPLRDRSAMRDYVQSWNTAFPDLVVRIVNKVASEDQVAVEVEFNGTNTGSMQMGPGAPLMPPTGKKVVNGRGTCFARVRDGKLIEIHTYPDLAGMMMQLGMMPAPGT
jgi:steroid delta-isomerase-like uncharacterized protein